MIRYICFILQSNVAASNAKLSLFYDWLFFDPEKDSIMNIGKMQLLCKFVVNLVWSGGGFNCFNLVDRVFFQNNFILYFTTAILAD